MANGASSAYEANLSKGLPPSTETRRHELTETQRLSPDDSGITAAATLLTEGRLVAFPTETVYGLGADACQGKAVARVYEAKGRPSFNPLIIHVADISAARAYAEFDDLALRLALAYWPGPLTLVLPLKPRAGLSELVTAGLDSVAVRVPAHPLAQRLLTKFAGPVAAPSANLSGKISPTTAEHALQGLAGRVDAVLDGGPTLVGLESTIVGMLDRPVLLRPGGLPTEVIEGCLARPLVRADDTNILAPGQLASHYAPNARLRLNAEHPEPGERYLAFGPHPDATLNLSVGRDLHEAAANLFGHLHALDADDGPIAVAPIPDKGLGLAINDRLRRAAAPRA